jgi:hypothetical protein
MPSRCNICNSTNIDSNKLCCQCNYYVCSPCHHKLKKTRLKDYVDIITHTHHSSNCREKRSHKYICASCLLESNHNQTIMKSVIDIENTLNQIFFDPSKIIVDYWNNDFNDKLEELSRNYFIKCDYCQYECIILRREQPPKK